jgi:hypothetical protein
MAAIGFRVSMWVSKPVMLPWSKPTMRGGRPSC